MNERGYELIKQLDRAGVQAGVLRVFLADERWAAALPAIDHQISLMKRQMDLLRSIKEIIQNYPENQ